MEQNKAPEMQNPSSPTSQVGYSQRPANARTQTYNRYLDSIWAWGNNLWFVLRDWIEQSWKLNRQAEIWHLTITIPVEWTYMILIEWVIYDCTNCKWLMVSWALNGWTVYEARTEMVSAYYKDLYVTRTDVVNLLKWDKISLDLVPASGTTTLQNAYIKIVKIS